MDFFNSLGKKISQTSQTAVEKTKEFTATTKLNFAINDAKNQISDYYRQIGQLYFTKYQNSPDPELDQLIQKVREKLAEIENLNEQVNEIKGITLCPSCGAEMSPAATFCSKCGNRR